MAPRVDDPETLPHENLASRVKEENDTTRNRNGSAQPTDEKTVNTPNNQTLGEVDLSIVWRNVIVFVVLHIGAVYGVYLCFFAKWQTLLFCKTQFIYISFKLYSL